MEVTSNTKDTLPSVAHEMKESGDATPVSRAVPNGSRCETSTNSYQVNSPSQLIASPKRKQFSPPEGEVTAMEPVTMVKQHCGTTPEEIAYPPTLTQSDALGKVSMKVTDFTYYQAQDEVKPTDLHHGWRQELKELGPIRIPARAEASVYPYRAKPKTPTYRGQTLRPKSGEQGAIRCHMRRTDEAIRRDSDWLAPLKKVPRGSH